jgi:hypothetical protein
MRLALVAAIDRINTAGKRPESGGIMTRCLLALGLVALLMGGAGCAPHSVVQSADATPVRDAIQTVIFDTRTDPDFGDAVPALRKLLAEAAPPIVGPQHFCVVGYRSAAGDEGAWVHWRERRTLIFWLGGGDPEYAAEAIVRSRRNLNLDRDVVATEADLAGSTYLVTKAWVAKTLADCAAKGAQYTVSR